MSISRVEICPLGLICIDSCTTLVDNSYSECVSVMKLHELPRTPLAQLPTPLEEFRHLGKALGGPQIWIKRDDMTGLALGGNKSRKLEFLIADALHRNADTVITAGAAQSNHCRQTAAAATRSGLSCHLVLGGTRPEIPDGNLLLDILFGARLHWTGMERRGERMEEIAEQLRSEGRTPYLIPYGGSNATGAVGFVLAMEELLLQKESGAVTHIVVPSSSGGTQAGLVVGARAAGFPGSIIGISIDKEERGPGRYETELANLSRATASHIGLDAEFTERDFCVNYDYLGKGYGVVGEPEREAIRLTATTEGVLLDPVYTGRAMAGLIDMIRRKEFSPNDTVLFWHTGGAPALFAYAREIV
jgi:D-cysteine desulfhydrase family pyridoxal phosphate-dependent enzyme